MFNVRDPIPVEQRISFTIRQLRMELDQAEASAVWSMQTFSNFFIMVAALRCILFARDLKELMDAKDEFASGGNRDGGA